MGKVGETNHKITGQRTDGLLCLWLTPSLVPREENPRKQSGEASKCMFSMARGSAGPCSGLPGAPFGVWGCRYPPSPLGQGPVLSGHRDVSSSTVLSNSLVVTHSSWEERKLSVGYVLALDGCSLLDPRAPASGDGEILAWNVETVAASESHCMSLAERDV